MKVRQLAFFVPFLVVAGCLEGSTGPQGVERPKIRLSVTGGIAGVDYTLLVDGPRREVMGVECLNGCGFEEGELLHGLTPEQGAYLASLFLDAEIHQLNGTDFGSSCCDQFHYDLTYQDSEGASTVRGASDALPDALLKAVTTVAAYARKVIPVVVAMDTDPARWRRDPAVLTGWGVSGDLAHLQVSFGGGCEAHYFDLVAHGGFRESQPVRVSAFLSHDGNGDLCEALLTKDLAFDLSPLKEAYQEAYGVAEPGTTTLVITLEDIPSPSSLMAVPLEYTF